MLEEEEKEEEEKGEGEGEGEGEEEEEEEEEEGEGEGEGEWEWERVQLIYYMLKIIFKKRQWRGSNNMWEGCLSLQSERQGTGRV